MYLTNNELKNKRKHKDHETKTQNMCASKFVSNDKVYQFNNETLSNKKKFLKEIYRLCQAGDHDKLPALLI